MTSETKQERSLRAIELEVLEEGREWTRRRLEQRLQDEANRHGGVFPPQRPEGASSAKRADGSADGGGSGQGGGLARPRPRGSALGLSDARRVGTEGPPTDEPRA